MTGPEKLQRLAQDIAGLMRQERLLDPTARTISPELGAWFVRAVADYLSAENPNLEKSLGLRRRRGQPRQGREAKNYKRAQKVFNLLRGAGGKRSLTMDQILEQHFPDANKNDLEKEQERYQPELHADLAEAVSLIVNARLTAKKAARRS